MQKKFQNKYRGQSTRLQTWDYSSEGSYFITICTKYNQHFFGKVVNGEMELSEIGKVVNDEWIKSIAMRPEMEIELGEFVVMPNHFHAIINIVRRSRRAATHRGPEYGMPSSASFPEISGIEISMPDISGNENTAAMRHGRTDALASAKKNQFGGQSNNIASIIRGFKSAVTCWCKKNGYPNFAWHPLFHDVIIRDEKAYQNISNYIINNPKKWDKDCFKK
jgi:putative transposase